MVTPLHQSSVTMVGYGLRLCTRSYCQKMRQVYARARVPNVLSFILRSREGDTFYQHASMDRIGKDSVAPPKVS